MTTRIVVALSLVVVPLAFAAGPPAGRDEQAAVDEKVLKDAGLAPDLKSLQEFFRKRTPTEDDHKLLKRLVASLGSNSFREREDASRELVLRGAPARNLLKEALASKDPEVARRARDCLDEIAGGPGAGLPVAAARTLMRRHPAEAPPVLVAFLPFADDEGVEEEVVECLLRLTPSQGGLHPTVAEALASPDTHRRAAAAYLAGRAGNDGQRDAARKLLGDKEWHVRLRAATGLLYARDKDAVEVLMRLLAEAPEAKQWQVEEMLYRVAGEKAPPVPGDAKPDLRARQRDAWLAWWKDNRDKVNLDDWADSARFLGLTLGIEYNTGRVWECGMDKSIRWEIQNLQGPMEAQVLPGGRVLIAESNAHLVSERDFKGNILWQHKIEGEPTGCQRLPNGNTFVSTYSSVMELRRDGTTVYKFNLPEGSNGIWRARNGNVLYVTGNGIVEIDPKNAPNKVRTIPLPPTGSWTCVRELPGDRFLVAGSGAGRVVEVDGKGNVRMDVKAPGACGVERLPNGNTLYGTSQRIVELDRDGNQVWSRDREGYVRRVHRR